MNDNVIAKVERWMRATMWDPVEQQFHNELRWFKKREAKLDKIGLTVYLVLLVIRLASGEYYFRFGVGDVCFLVWWIFKFLQTQGASTHFFSLALRCEELAPKQERDG